eukprot:gene4508-16191_t
MVNGKPCCANAELLHTLRKDWNFDGYITSDSDSCGDIYASHHYAKDPQHAAQLCLAGGTNIDSGNTYSKNIAPGVAAGVVNLSDARAALRGAYKFRMTLGLFDPNITDANRKITPDVIGNDEHRLTSLMTARQSMTLLKNDLAKGLPFTPGKKLAVIGPDSDSIQSIMQPSNYNSNNICPPQHGAGAGAGGTGGAGGGGESAGVNFSCLDTLWAGLNKTNAAAGGSSTLITAGAGSTWNATGIAAAVALAQAADNVIVFVSNAEIEGGEGHDRASIALPPDQIALAAAVFKAIAGKPGVRSAMLMINGGVMAYDDFKETPPSILEIFMPGVYGAQAVAETVWGTNVPSGKLPFTMYYSNYTDGLSIDDMSMTAGPGRTYWSPTQPPAAAAGAAVIRSVNDVTIYSVVVKNTGATYAADEVVLAFFKPTKATIPSLATTGTPVVIKQLFGFEKVHLEPGASTTLNFTVPASTFGLADHEGHTSLHPGEYQVIFSRGCVDCSELAAKTTIEADAPIRLKTFRKWW